MKKVKIMFLLIYPPIALFYVIGLEMDWYIQSSLLDVVITSLAPFFVIVGINLTIDEEIVGNFTSQ